MTAIFSTSIRSPSAAAVPVSTKLSSTKPARRLGSSGSVKGAESDGRRDQLQRLIRDHAALAQQAAEQGDLAQAARFILAALDGERQMASKGPQVLQLIKPRG